ncbi:MAG: glk [Nevskia sp.]|nr:glk [Nevskia sp.]
MEDGSKTYPRLVGDIGGTHARFALVRGPGAALEFQRTLECAHFDGPAAAIGHYLHGLSAPPPLRAVLGVATPVTGDDVRLINHPWRFSVEGLRRGLRLERLVVINDFEAMACAIPSLGASGVEQIGGGAALAGSPLALLGPGTGLGVATLAPTASGYVPLAGEGGHVTLAACNDAEADVFRILRQRHGHVSAERVLSGPGLEELYALLSVGRGQEAEPLRAEQISARGIAATCAICAEAMQLFCAVLGTVASNLALTVGARGGVYIGGGIVPRFGAYLAASAFRRRFEDKGRFASYLAAIPTYVIRAENPGLIGAARYLDRFGQKPH